MKNVSKKKFLINGFLIRIVITNKIWKQNSYLVTDIKSGEQILIDPGGEPSLIKKLIRSEGNGSLNHILLTHAHFDHIGAAAEIKKYFNVPCYLCNYDFRLMRQANLYTIKFGGKKIEIPYDVKKFNSSPEIKVGNYNIETIFTPGHTLGGVSYVFNGFLFTGDTLLYKSVGRADLPGSDIKKLKRSVDTILNLEINDGVIFSGHGTHWSISEARLWWYQERATMPQYNMFIK